MQRRRPVVQIIGEPGDRREKDSQRSSPSASMFERKMDTPISVF
jgi:hypothetical protein